MSRMIGGIVSTGGGVLLQDNLIKGRDHNKTGGLM